MKVSSFKDAVSRMPQDLYDSLLVDYDRLIVDQIIRGYMEEKITSLRVNLLKSNVQEVIEVLKSNSIKFDRVNFSNEVLIIKDNDLSRIQELDIYNQGKIYLQSLSSCLPPIILNPKKNTRILDMTAAPGGKTSELASLINDEGEILALELDKIRYEKLVYNINKQGAKSVTCKNIDARKMQEGEFDYILLDAPCSGSGTVDLNDKKSYMSFSSRLVDKCSKSQYELLKKALSSLKSGSTITYSTCSILKKENEDIINRILEEFNDVRVVPIELNFVKSLPLLPTSIKGALTIMPNKFYEGFFICKLRKK